MLSAKRSSMRKTLKYFSVIIRICRFPKSDWLKNHSTQRVIGYRKSRIVRHFVATNRCQLSMPAFGSFSHSTYSRPVPTPCGSHRWTSLLCIVGKSSIASLSVLTSFTDAWIITLSVLSLAIIYPYGNLRAVDAYFFGASASTESGLNTSVVSSHLSHRS